MCRGMAGARLLGVESSQRFVRSSSETNTSGLENITASESKIRDADFATETALLTRAQILNQAGTSILATANSNAQNVLALLQ